MALLELERSEVNEMIEEHEGIWNGEIGIADMEEREIDDEERRVEEVVEPGWQEEVVEQSEEEEDDEEDNLTQAVKSWPVLSKYQSTRFKHRILTEGMIYLFELNVSL